MYLSVCLTYQCNVIVISLISLRNVQEWRDRNRKALECKDQRGESCYFKKEKFDLFIKSKCFQQLLSLSSIAIYCHKDHEDNAMREGFQSQESILDRPCVFEPTQTWYLSDALKDDCFSWFVDWVFFISIFLIFWWILVNHQNLEKVCKYLCNIWESVEIFV